MRRIFSRLPMPIRRRNITTDPLRSGLAGSESRLVPIRIDMVRVTRNLEGEILKRRYLPEPLSIEYDKRLGIIIPFRNREAHLAKLLPVLRRILDDQQIDYRLIVVEQVNGKLFNRGKLINVGSRIFADKLDYFCFHDVDALPEKAIYGCPSQPLRLVSMWTQTWRTYDISAMGHFSIAVTIRKDQFENVNGYCNQYWGWGQEDTDFFVRCLLGGLVPHEDSTGTFREFENPKHEERRRTTINHANKRWQRWQMLLRRYDRSGLSTLEYDVLDRNSLANGERILVDI